MILAPSALFGVFLRARARPCPPLASPGCKPRVCLTLKMITFWLLERPFQLQAACN